MICVTRVAKSALDKALAENEDIDSILGSPPLPIVGEAPTDFHQPLIIKIDAAAAANEAHEKWTKITCKFFSPLLLYDVIQFLCLLV